MAFAAPFMKSLALTALCLTIAAGCGGSGGDNFTGERGQVSGTVTVDGQPLQAGCQVLFMSPTAGYTASGIVEEGGKYTLVYEAGAGLPVGDYQVQFGMPVAAESTTPAPVVDPSAMGNALKLDKNSSSKPASDATPFPIKYGSSVTSELTYTVKAGANTADFNLEK